MYKNLFGTMLGAIGVLVLSLGAINAEFSQVINITGFDASGQSGQLLQSNNQIRDDLELYFLYGTTVKHFTIMDRNLGATEPYNQQYLSDSSKINTNSFGYHYQRGNNYGFAPCINNPLTDDTCTNFPGGETTTSTVDKTIWSVYSPSRYARNTWSKSYNWMGGSTENDNIWGGGGDTSSSNHDNILIGKDNDWSILSGRQGPCPTNYYVPSVYDWVTLRDIWVITTAYGKGSQFASDLLLPPAGTRDYDKYIYGQGAFGVYWSSSPSPTTNFAYDPYFDSSNISPKYSSFSRSFGGSIRCAKSSPNGLAFTLNANGGKNVVVAFTGDIGYGRFTSLGTPTRANSTFEGWYTANEGGEKLGIGSGVVSIINARWSCKTGYVDNGTGCVECPVGYTSDAGAKSQSECYRSLTVTFDKNGAISVSSGSVSCRLNYGNESCEIMAPTITPADGFTVIGWNKNVNSHEKDFDVNVYIPVSGNITYYAQSSKSGYKVTVSYGLGTGVSEIGTTSDECSVETVYNGTDYTACDITLPTITLKSGYNTGIWSTGTISKNPGETIGLLVNEAYTASATPNEDTPYYIKYYFENVDGTDYELSGTENLSGRTDSLAEKFEMVEFSGFTFSGDKSITSGKITGSGDLVLSLYYDRNSYEYSIQVDGKVIQSGNVKFGSWITKPADPTKNGYKFIGWEPEIPTTMPAGNMTVKAKWEKLGSSGGGGGGGGGGGNSSSNKTGSTSSQTGNQINSNTGDAAPTGTNIKEPETNTGSNTQTGSQVNSPEQTPQNDNSNTQDSTISSQNDGKTYFTEFQEAYEFAKGNGITTMPTIQKANMEGKLTRIAMAKMLSQYAMNVLGQEPSEVEVPKFNDVTDKQNSDYDDGVTLAYQLGIMGQNMPNNNFRPNDEVTRAEFATALSRMIYGTSDGEYKGTGKYYIHHMKKLVEEGIITKNDPNMKELRGYVMIMLMRSSK